MQALVRQGGNYSDLYPRWLGARELLLRGRNPYSDAVTAEIQLGFYGRVLSPGGSIKDIQAFAYPVLVVPLLAPFVSLPFSIAAHLVVAIMVVGLVVGLWIWAGAVRPGGRRTWRAGAALLPLMSVPIIEAVLYQQLTLLSLALLAVAGGLLSQGRLFGVGLALALLSFKPHVAVLPMLGVLLWAAGAPRSRAPLLWTFCIGVGVLLGISELLLPGWVWDFARGVQAYGGYVVRTSPLQTVLGNGGLALLAGAGVVAWALWLWWCARDEPAHSPRVRRAFVTSVTVTTVLMPVAGFYDKGLLILPLLFLLAQPEPSVGRGVGRWAQTAVVQLVALTYATQALTGLLLALGSGPLPRPLAYFPLVTWQFFLPLIVLAALAPWERLSALSDGRDWLLSRLPFPEHLARRQRQPEHVS